MGDTITLRELMAAPLDPDRCEATRAVYWMIIDPAKVPLVDYRSRIDFIANACQGPFFSRDHAQTHLDAQRHRYSPFAVVYGCSAHMSRDYEALLALARTDNEVEAKQREAVENACFNIHHWANQLLADLYGPENSGTFFTLEGIRIAAGLKPFNVVPEVSHG